MLSSSGLSATSTTAPTEEQAKRIAALELLSHTYFHSTKGQEAVWIVSVPKHYTAWPHVAISNKPIGTVLTTLNIGGDEKFSFEDRRHIATAGQTGLAWTHKALIALDNVKARRSYAFVAKADKQDGIYIEDRHRTCNEWRMKWKPNLGGLLASVLLLTSATHPGLAATNHPKPREKAMSDSDLLGEAFDRSPPPDVAAVVYHGKRYAQHIGTHDDNIGQSGGLLDIFEETTGKLIATITVDDNVRNPDWEGDVQDIFFEAMAFDDSRRLIITDEVGRRFAVDVDQLQSTPLP